VIDAPCCRVEVNKKRFVMPWRLQIRYQWLCWNCGAEQASILHPGKCLKCGNTALSRWTDRLKMQDYKA